jgi:phosphoribosylamine--glycine ligase
MIRLGKGDSLSYKIGFAGTDGRTLLSAVITSTAKSEMYENEFQGVVIRGTPAMPPFAKRVGWPVEFIPTANNSVEGYGAAIREALKGGLVDCVVPMPEDLLYNGLVDEVKKAGLGGRIAGLTKSGAFIEGDKIACKRLCAEYSIPVADQWQAVDARDYRTVREISLRILDLYGGAVLKYPYSAGGKGSRIILDAWEIREVYDALVRDYRDSYKGLWGDNSEWPLLIESRMSGVEISFTILMDKDGNFQILPTAMDYPERFAIRQKGPASKENPITGGMGSISPHPMETSELIQMAAEDIAQPLARALREKQILRPCVLYPGCIISLDSRMKPTRIRVCEINIRPGEPEFQPVARRLRNLGALVKGMFAGNLDQVAPEVRTDQISLCIALATGPGGPDGQKGYPWSCTKGEPIEMDLSYFRKKNIQVIPSAMTYLEDQDLFKSDGSRVAFLNANATVKPGEVRAEIAERLRQRLYTAFAEGKIRVVPREDSKGNRLILREDIGSHYEMGAQLFSE